MRSSIHDSLSEMNTTRSAFAFSRLSCASGAEQFVPPPPIAASLSAFVITLSRGFKRRSTTACSNGSTRAPRLLRNPAAAIRAATSMQRTADEAPLRWPVTGDCIEPETSGHTITRPDNSGTFASAISIASCNASRTADGTNSPAALWAAINW